MPPPTSRFSAEEPISPDVCFASYFLKIYPLVIGLRLLDELVSCLSWLYFLTRFLSKTNSSADPLVVLILVKPRTGTERALLSKDSTFLRIYYKFARSSYDLSFSATPASFKNWILLRLADSNFFFVWPILLTLAESGASCDRKVELICCSTVCYPIPTCRLDTLLVLFRRRSDDYCFDSSLELRRYDGSFEMKLFFLITSGRR